MITVDNPSKCCGCTACFCICPHDAIRMVPDALGFLYPKVDMGKCVNCGLCEKVCSFKTGYDISENFETPITYGVRHKDIHEIEKSRSGATFAAISDYVLKVGGHIYGVGFKNHFVVSHKKACDADGRDEFRGSKYVQSELSDTFRLVKEDLQNNHIVLFAGTPCQVAGLKSYIPKRLRKNLLLMDVVCHGVPSPYIWRDYIQFLEKKYGSQITSVNFRNKKLYGWAEHKETFEFEGVDDVITPKFTFYKDLYFRKSCYSCPFTNIHRTGDITIADFWGWEKCVPQFNVDNKGCSLVLVNTPKGKDFFNKAANVLNVIPVEISDCLQPNMQRPTFKNPKRDQFEHDYSEKGFTYVYYKYGEEGWRCRIRAKLGQIHLLFKKVLKCI